MNALTVRFLQNRGLSDLTAYAALETTPPALLENVDQACALLQQARLSHTSVLCLTDYDCDGIMSSMVLGAALAELGFTFEMAVRSAAEGYGLSADTVRRICAEHPRAGLVITADVGIGEAEGIEAMHEAGRRVIVTDHHIGVAADCPADVVVDPCAAESAYPLKTICGAYVAWKVMDRFAELYGTAYQRQQVRRLRMFAAVGTLGDSMALVGENRQLLRDGISIVRYVSGKQAQTYEGTMPYSGAFSGFGELVRQAAESKRVTDIDEEFVTFYVVPAINAIKRLGLDTSYAYNLMFADDKAAAAAALIRGNEQRKARVASVTERIRQLEQPFEPYAYITDEQDVGGIVGLVASQLSEAKHHPVLVLARDSDGSLHGSGRSYGDVPALDVINGNGGWAHGHQAAFGCGFDGYASLRLAVAALEEASKDIKPPDPLADADFILGLDEPYDKGMLEEFYEDLSELHPFGSGFGAPVVGIALQPDWDVTTFGKADRHLKCRTPFGIEAIAWGQGASAETVARSGGIVLGSLGQDRWGYRPQMEVKGRLVFE